MLKPINITSDHTHIAIVTYFPVYPDGTLGHRQEAQFAWDGPASASESVLLRAASRFFEDKHGPRQDRVTRVQLLPRPDHSPTASA